MSKSSLACGGGDCYGEAAGKFQAALLKLSLGNCPSQTATNNDLIGDLESDETVWFFSLR